MNRIESNKLIMEFMGVEPTKIDGSYYLSHQPFFAMGDIKKENVIDGYAKYSKYDTSWDWLMPVIDKIYSSDEYQEYLKEMNTTFWDGIEINTKFIQSTYNEVVDFLKWILNFNKEDEEYIGYCSSSDCCCTDIESETCEKMEQ